MSAYQDYGPFGDGVRLVTIDVIGLYTNIPHHNLLTPTYPTTTSSHQHTPPGPPHGTPVPSLSLIHI